MGFFSKIFKSFRKNKTEKKEKESNKEPEELVVNNLEATSQEADLGSSGGGGVNSEDKPKVEAAAAETAAAETAADSEDKEESMGHRLSKLRKSVNGSVDEIDADRKISDDYKNFLKKESEKKKLDAPTKGDPQKDKPGKSPLADNGGNHSSSNNAKSGENVQKSPAARDNEAKKVGSEESISNTPGNKGVSKSVKSTSSNNNVGDNNAEPADEKSGKNANSKLLSVNTGKKLPSEKGSRASENLSSKSQPSSPGKDEDGESGRDPSVLTVNSSNSKPDNLDSEKMLAKKILSSKMGEMGGAGMNNDVNEDEDGQLTADPTKDNKNSDRNTLLEGSAADKMEKEVGEKPASKEHTKPAIDSVVSSSTKDLGIFDGPRAETNKVNIKAFKFYRTVGTGSFGRVRLVKHRSSGNFYAVKILNKDQVVKSKQVEHINTERAALAFCNCPFIVKIHGTSQDSLRLFMFMEYIVGGEMFTYLRRYKKFPSPVAKFYSAEVLVAFEYLHGHDIIYRDLKPENLLIDKDGHIKLTDLGFAKHVPDITWTLCGTPDYLAPEIIQSKGYGKSVDWYSLGVLIFEMIAGYPPFYEDDHYKLYERILANRIQWPSKFDKSAADLVRKLVTPDLTKRYGNLKNGVKDIINHKWYEEVDWVKLASKRISAPLIPSIKEDGDTSNFDKYPETNDEYGDNSTRDPYRNLFLKF
ncbi:cAMP-dependent protein kinase type 1 [Smittium culicis]|uniref:cAMP-dependent protein kinase n=1 Tax=Smittium culicis TaxID=133412 RepID=A0A1R1Y2G0_9FUNG|nr:cAMP-dependent protein kinase type 1 [Smittium culicis]